jgi:phosphoribosylformimino-5-aminoimidazole carboxamide ribotide isomerase
MPSFDKSAARWSCIMKVIPVLDIMQGQVVRGVAGNRAEYRPVVSQLTSEVSPRGMARALVERFGFADAYVADLDAISGGEPDWKSYLEATRCGLRLWIDAGVKSPANACLLCDRLKREGVSVRIVAGLETLDGAESLRQIIAALGPEQVIFSLDLKQGVPLARSAEWQGLAPTAIAELAAQCGVTAMIVLDLAHVGMGQGVATGRLAQQIRRQHSSMELIGGGGVRSVDDLKELAGAGFDAALVASALHDGRLTRGEIGKVVPQTLR